MTYEDFISASDVATFKRVKRAQMRLATVARHTAAHMVGGHVASEGKEFVTTKLGVYRLAMTSRSDNNTEKREHDRLGAKTIYMGNDEMMHEFFTAHGWTGLTVGLTVHLYRRLIKERL